MAGANGVARRAVRCTPWLLLLLLPGVGASVCHSHVGFDLGADDVVVRVTAVYDGLDAARFRARLDRELGDRDGLVEDDETGRYEASAANVRPAAWDLCARDGVLRREGRMPDGLGDRVAAVDIGSRNVGATQPLRVTMTTVFEWSGPPRQRATYQIDVEDQAYVEGMASCLGAAALTPYPAQPCGSSEWVVSTHGGALLRDEIEAQGLAPWMARGAVVVADTAGRERFLNSDQVFTWVDEGTGVLAPLLAGAGLVSVALALWAWSRESLRFALLRPLALLAGFSRITRDDAAAHPRREAILDLVHAEPGIHLTELRRRIGCGSGSLVHHVRVLERLGLIQVVREAAHVRFLPPHHDRPPGPRLTEVQERLLDAVRRRPGTTQKELAAVLDAPRGTIAYNARRLESLGLLRMEKDGPRQRHFLAAGDQPWRIRERRGGR